MVYRIYVEKKPQLRQEAQALLAELRELPEVSGLRDLRLLNRYDAEQIDAQLFEQCVGTVFSEPPVDDVYRHLPEGADAVIAVEYLPGQFDQRADSAEQCVQLISQQQRPHIVTARLYLLYGSLDQRQLAAIKRYLINPVECREAQLDLPETLNSVYPPPAPVKLLQGFAAASDERLAAYIADYGLAMDAGDLACCRAYFAAERRDPTLTELRVLDTYWSDHCRHTTFGTVLDEIVIDDADAAAAYANYQRLRGELQREHTPPTLMDMATMGMRYLRHQGLLPKLDVSPEINACTVRIEADIDGEKQPWLLLFKNETHNHPTEIEPFGGAATCLGGAIRDPLSGRAYVYQAMRLTGAADPLQPYAETLPGKLPQRKLTVTAAAGYSSYGNQIGLATGLVDEWYHPGYAAKRMEIGAVIGAVPAANVRREQPADGDLVLLLGGRTGRDGCGGATGSSKSHDAHSLESCGSEVQKGNAPEERKLQRLFRNAELTRLIKRCNDFGAGGVSVAIGELADGLEIQLDAVPKKYEGLDGTELAISESQERMAVVVASADAPRMIELAAAENLEATVVATVKAERRLKMYWQGRCIVDLSRDFLDSNGAAKHARVHICQGKILDKPAAGDFAAAYRRLAGDLNCCSRRGLSERFDSTVGARTLLMPFGGKHQLTPPQVMAAKLPLLRGDSHTCSLMSWGFDPYISEQSPYHGAYLAVLSSVCKLAAAGAPLDDCYLSLQEYFPKLGQDAKRWGLPAAALLGALQAQLDLGVAAIGGKDSMSGSFEQLDVPPTLVSFAVAVGDARRVVSPEFKQAGGRVVLLEARRGANGLPEPQSMREVLAQVQQMNAAGRLRAAYAPAHGGIAEAVLKMCLGNALGFAFDGQLPLKELFAPACGCFVLETDDGESVGRPLGTISAEPFISGYGVSLPLHELCDIYEARLEGVFPLHAGATAPAPPCYDARPAASRLRPRVACAKPRFLLPVFPGTNCEYDTAAAIERAGGEAQLLVINNLNAQAVAESARRFAEAIAVSQAIVIPGGFSGGDEPDGSGKFITAFFRNPAIAEQVHQLLKQRDGLICGICNGFQALIKLGLAPYGEITACDASSPTLTFNTIGRHQSRLIRTRVCANSSPWLALTEIGDIYTLPVSHGEGRFLCEPQLLEQLAANGQIAAQYVDMQGQPSMDIRYNVSGSLGAVEAITSPDGRVLGKMGHSERIGSGLYRNVPGEYDMRLFEAAVAYYR
ncbi:MAG: phosphoribosylformylglycinamidine synthase [Bacillota bacterium]|nr:phosphoribosylformylglycinamidine synthase [Bacillota bacterium]